MRLYIFGAGGHGVVIAELAAALGHEVAGFIDDNPTRVGARVLGWPVLGGIEAIPPGASVALGIGENASRREKLALAGQHGWALPVLIHPAAVISPSAELGAGTVVMALAAVNARARIGRGCILNTSCSVSHDCVLGDVVHISPGTHLAGTVTIGDNTLIGMGATILNGANCTIGAGSVLVANLPDGVTAYGNPARIQNLPNAL